MNKREHGLYKKFTVERTDGSSAIGYKHEGCRYFVLDLMHDPHAVPALIAYALSASHDGYLDLPRELMDLTLNSSANSIWSDQCYDQLPNRMKRFLEWAQKDLGT